MSILSFPSKFIYIFYISDDHSHVVHNTFQFYLFQYSIHHSTNFIVTFKGLVSLHCIQGASVGKGYYKTAVIF